VFERAAESLDDAERTRVFEELRVTRQLAAQRLATTVTALETIRLDLLRLQMGSAGIESVTASLDAPRRGGDRIAESIAARAGWNGSCAGSGPRSRPAAELRTRRSTE
jgi:hypothetical protein